MGVKLSDEAFISRAKTVHGERYDYSKTVYTSSQEKVTITCSIHGDFTKTASKHTLGQGCPTCSAATDGQWRISDSGTFISKYEKVSEVFDGSTECFISVGPEDILLAITSNIGQLETT